MASLSEMNQALVKVMPTPAVIDGEFEEGPNGEEFLMEQDLSESMAVHKQCMHLFDYMGDPELCKTISKRERESMARMAEKLRNLLEDLESKYGDDF